LVVGTKARLQDVRKNDEGGKTEKYCVRDYTYKKQLCLVVVFRMAEMSGSFGFLVFVRLSIFLTEKFIRNKVENK